MILLRCKKRILRIKIKMMAVMMVGRAPTSDSIDQDDDADGGGNGEDCDDSDGQGC